MDKYLKNLGIDYDRIGESRSGYRNTSYPIYLKNGKVLNLIIFKDEEKILERIKRANSVGNFFAKNGIPSRETVLIQQFPAGIPSECNNSSISSEDSFGMQQSRNKKNDKSELRIENSDHENKSSIIKFTNRKTGEIRYGCFYKYLPGETIPWDGYSSKHIKLLGGMMGEMHRTIMNYKSGITNFPDEIGIQIANIDRMEKYIFQEEVVLAMKKKLNLEINFDFDKYRKIFKSLESEQKQVLHMDFVRGNVLFQFKIHSLKATRNSKVKSQELKISGVLDFEKVSIGPRILDIARTLAFLIVDCKYKDSKKVWKYFLFNGYQKRGQNTLPDLKFLADLVQYFWIYDLYKFLKYNPYESLNQNEHFMRTVFKVELVSAAVQDLHI